MIPLLLILVALGGSAAWLWKEDRRIACARRELEEERRAFSTDRGMLRSLLAQCTDHIYFKDASGRFLLVSASLARALGFDDPEDLIGKSDFDFFRKMEVFDSEDDERLILRTGQFLPPHVRAKRWPDGSTRWRSTCKWPLINEDGKVWGIFGISRDVPASDAGKADPI